MASPRQVAVEITYDGTAKKVVAQAVEATTGAKASDGTTYTVVRGDCLWNIAKRFLGSGTKYTLIYDANKDTIENTAKAHGKASSDHGHWIWPGEVLAIPGQEKKAETTTQTKVETTGNSNPALGSKIEQQLTGFTYTDVASGQSDSVSITMHDIGHEWMGKLMPKRGADIGAKIKPKEYDGLKAFNCGTFILDDISFSGKPTNCVLGGVSVPAMDDFKSLPVTKTWEKTTIQEIASEIAKAAGVSLHYDADKIQIAELEQSSQTNSAFLYSLCDKYGLALKVYNHKLVIFDIVAYEEKKAVATISETDMTKWSYNTTVDGTYTGVSLNYTDPDTDSSINVTMGKKGRMYSLNTQASSRYDAELQAAAKVNSANRSIETLDITIRARSGIVASQCIQITGLGKIDGKYYIDKAKHDIGNKGYTIGLSLHKVQEAIKVTQPVKTAASTGGQSYTVVSGDTLWGISKKFYGTGTKYNIIYEANKDIIEATAKQHGKKSSDNGHWIWPGETFTIPEA